MTAATEHSAAAVAEEAAGASFAKSIFREYVETIVVCVMFLLFARTFVAMQSKIPTESMLDTLQIGDYILINRFVYGGDGDTPLAWLGQREIRRGDVVVFRYPLDPDVDYVKRVVGLPGDVVEVREGHAYVNGEPVDGSYVKFDPDDPQLRNYAPVSVPPGSYFMMGDNRDHSSDSRFWGFADRSLIKGRAFLIWFSYREQKNDHLNTGYKRIVSMLRKVFHPQGIRPERIFMLIR